MSLYKFNNSAANGRNRARLFGKKKNLWQYQTKKLAGNRRKPYCFSVANIIPLYAQKDET